MQRTPRWRCCFNSVIIGAGSLIRNVRQHELQPHLCRPFVFEVQGIFTHVDGVAELVKVLPVARYGYGFSTVLFSMFSDWGFPWYYGVSILAGELLLFYIVSFISGFILMFRDIRPSRCPECRSSLITNGSYFNDAEKANLDDIVLSILYVGANIGIWIFIVTRL
jgi:hypothetical protein